MRAVVFTLGCKVNDVESGSLVHGLKSLGYEVSRELEKADLYILNTCAVTGEAERKSRQTVGKLQKLNPNARIIVCGCASEKSPEAFLGKNVYAVFGAKKKGKILELAKEQFTDKTFTLPIQVNNLPAQETIHLFPQEVVVTVRVGISHFAQINEADLQAVCPYPTKGAATLPIEIIHTNPNITQIRTNIREVEYIIER